MIVLVFVTETWAYFQSQLDRARKIKVHALRPDSNRSYCGINFVGSDYFSEWPWEEFRDNPESCARCRRAVPLEE